MVGQSPLPAPAFLCTEPWLQHPSQVTLPRKRLWWKIEEISWVIPRVLWVGCGRGWEGSQHSLSTTVRGQWV